MMEKDTLASGNYILLLKHGFSIGYVIGRKYQSIWVWVLVLDLNQNSGFGRTLKTLLFFSFGTFDSFLASLGRN